MKKTIYLLTRGDDDSGLQVICAYTTEKDAKQALLALAKEDGGGSLEIKWLTPTSYQVIDPKDPNRNIVDDAGINEVTLVTNVESEPKIKKRYLIVRDYEPTGLPVIAVCETYEAAIKRLKKLVKEDSAKYRKPYVWWLSSTSYRVFYPPESSTVVAAAFILPDTISVYDHTASRTVYLLVTDSTPGPDVISVFETKEAAITALKERAARDVKCERTVKLIWRTPTRYDIIEEPGSHDFITVEIIERPLQKECDRESSLHTC